MQPVEIVVRGYMTGSSDTAIWTHYSNGVRTYCGIDLPEGMVKNQPFETSLITPTTKGDEHDELISAKEIVDTGLVDADTWAEVEKIALALFARGTELAAKQGLILVDTKYEMGQDEEGRITLADEIHTPDSSRYWIKETYEERHARGEEPESLDKEFLRLWLREIRIQVAERYIDLCERVTCQAFEPEIGDAPVQERIEKAIAEYF